MPSSVPPLKPVCASVDDERLIFPLTVEAYHRMIAEGILPEGEPFELLNGQIIRKDRSAAGEDATTVGNAHAWVIATLAELNPKLRRLGCHIRIQLPLTFVPLSEPEPDAAIALGSKDDYRDHHYVIINLIDRMIEVYAQPITGKGGAARYGSTVTLQPGDRLELPATRGRVLGVAVRKLLP